MRTLLILLWFVAGSSFSYAQTRVLSGQVNKMGGGTIAGVKIVASEAPSIQTLSDASGRYQIEVPPEVKSLEVSYAGFQTQKVLVGKFNTVNVVLIPEELKTLRFGFGLGNGFSSFSARTAQGTSNDTTFSLDMRNISLHLDLRYNFSKRFSLQFIPQAELHLFKYTQDDETAEDYGDTKEGGILRTAIPLPFSYNFSFGKSGNYSGFIGLGPQLYHYSYFNTISSGFKFRIGSSFNNYGFNTQLYIDYDYAGGTLKEIDEIESVKFEQSGIQFGVAFYL